MRVTVPYKTLKFYKKGKMLEDINQIYVGIYYFFKYTYYFKLWPFKLYFKNQNGRNLNSRASDILKNNNKKKL